MAEDTTKNIVKLWSAVTLWKQQETPHSLKNMLSISSNIVDSIKIPRHCHVWIKILTKSSAIRSNNTAHPVNMLNRTLYLFHKILLISGNDIPLSKHNKITKNSWHFVSCVYMSISSVSSCIKAKICLLNFKPFFSLLFFYLLLTMRAKHRIKLHRKTGFTRAVHVVKLWKHNQY